MRDLGEIELQLSRLGVRNRFWGKAEVRELKNILSDNEVIINAVNGRYEGGFALLLATDQRLLLVDKKIWFLSIEDVRFEMVSEVDYCARLLDATMSVMTINKVLRFTSIKQKSLRALTTYLQSKIIELRQNPAIQINPYQQQQQFASPVQTLVQPQHQSVAQLADQKLHTIRQIGRIGAYPAASFTIQKRFSR